VPKRICRTCSVFPLSPLKLSVELIPKTKLYSLSKLINFTNFKSNDSCFLSGDECPDHCWWPEITINNHLFPSCQLARTKKYVTESYLKSIGVKIFPVHNIETKLKKVDRHNQKIDRNEPGNLPDIKEDVARCQHDTLQKILEVMHFKSPSKHTASIHSYRYISMSHLMKSPPPCPTCLAISLWFFNIAISEYNIYHYKHISNYPFLKDLGYMSFYNPSRFTYLTKNFQHYNTSERFSVWSYKRSLELSFIDIFQIVLFIMERCEKRDFDPNHYYESDSFRRSYIGGDYLLDVTGNKAKIYYADANPLEKLKSYSSYNILKRCDKYKAYLHFCMSDDAKFFFDLQTNRPSFKKFLELHTQFKEFVQLPPPEYSPGSSPMIRT
jgi:hypothetical protein